MEAKIGKDFREFIELLNTEGAKYVVVGGYAVGYHGFSRFTDDIDLFVEASPQNSQRILSAMRQFGAPTAHLRESDLTTPGMVIQFGRVPNRIDILTSLEGVRFDNVWKRRIEARLDKLRVPFIGLGHLLRNKRAVGRPEDLTDVARIQRRNRSGRRKT
jgi:predicted nucleotidyltransferase